MTPESIDPGHGHSPAAWTAVIIMLIAFGIGTAMLFIGQPYGVVAAAGLLIVGLIVGWVLEKVGFGVNGPRYQPKGH
ncbi:HGxxPAAW family protein [Microbacterium sp. MPKO10]|uniref:HGxxPAAW family protein n=1 Tax=Microbacterium sp. MPKO10 TaxID=2989818 RepID=UPI002236705B|nr:HGxxPAAW family protein [Microbacterium sp. MPKO10]MCW4459525.1 hypothetical protein [Microbacterium sp. MPKO10]